MDFPGAYTQAMADGGAKGLTNVNTNSVRIYKYLSALQSHVFDIHNYANLFTSATNAFLSLIAS